MKADLYDIQKRDTMAARKLFRSDKEWTKEDIVEAGRTSNIFSGRGTGLKGGNPWADWVFLARRWAWSRIQTDFVVPFQLMTPKMIGQWNADRGMRVAMAKLYLQALMGHATKTALAYWMYTLLAGDDEEKKPTIEWDLRSSDALALKMGETRLKDEGGTVPYFVLAARLATGETKTAKGEIKPIRGEDVQPFARRGGDYIVDAIKYKAGTGVSGILEWASDRDAVGQPVTNLDIVTTRVTPLTWREIADAERELGVKQGTLAAWEAFFGATLSTYGPRTKYRKANKEKREDLFDKFLKGMKWDAEPPAFQEFLTRKQRKQVEDKLKEKKGKLVNDAMFEPDPKDPRYKEKPENYKKRVEKRDKDMENFKSMDLTKGETIKLLDTFYEDEKTGRLKRTDAYRGRKKAINKFYR